MTRGWFVGDFEPTALKTQNCEVSYRNYKEGDTENKHYHKIATELTVITSGKVLMNGVEYTKGDIVIIAPGEIADFKALTDSTNIVVKVPGAKDDKYLA